MYELAVYTHNVVSQLELPFARIPDSRYKNFHLNTQTQDYPYLRHRNQAEYLSFSIASGVLVLEQGVEECGNTTGVRYSVVPADLLPSACMSQQGPDNTGLNRPRFVATGPSGMHRLTQVN